MSNVLKKVPQFEPYVGLDEYESIKSCFDINWITEGPKSKEFVEKLCKKIGVEYGVLAPNGTLALYMGLKAMGIGVGDEVIVPNFTFIASANAIEMVGATPVFVDVNVEDCQISVEDCERVITPKTKAIMPIQLYGMSSNMTEVMGFANKHNIKVIEDSAQGLGVEWAGKGCGSFGEVATFSFFADKTITTGEGGLVCTNDKDIYEQLLYIRNQGRINRGSFVHPEIGYNFRMTDIQSAIGLTQLGKFDEIAGKKNVIHKVYTDLLKDVTEIKIIQPRDEVTSYIPFRVLLLTETEKSNKLIEFMSEHGIEPRTFFYPLHRQPCYKDTITTDNDFPNSVYLYEHGICLPSFANLSIEQITHVCDTIKKYFNYV